MSFYTVQVHAEGIRLPGSDPSKPIIGFYTSRTVWATNDAVAGERALASVRQLWATGEYGPRNEGAPPSLAVESCNRVGFRDWLLAPNKGHCFYHEDEHAV